MKLISMTDFVLEIYSQKVSIDNALLEMATNMQECGKYANFLKQPLCLWMLIPCDLDGNPLDKPLECVCEDGYECKVKCTGGGYVSEYNRAKERCLFEVVECEVDELKDLCNYNYNIEDALRYLRHFPISKTGIKQIQK